ncbi:MAG TPA: ProQ/FINO family protein, partial [Candidatus Competibacteraceae bacterium]|nr:ProQ/FINO family protein [Candidatus Competibacteraceae bacterium]
MSHQRPPASELLPLLAAVFPQTFFTDAKQVRPLKINIHHDLYARFQAHALPADIDPGGIKRLLRWYTQRTAYLKALARGDSRVDLDGADVDPHIPEAIREQPRQALARRQTLKTGTAGFRKTASRTR